MLQFGASLTYDTSRVNNDRNVFILQATGVDRIIFVVEYTLSKLDRFSMVKKSQRSETI